jgi:hypothetical protein
MKPRGANTRSRLLCPQCADLKQVSAINSDEITLSCGHVRAQIIPLEPGRVSIENLRTEAGRKLFPANRQSEMTANRLPWIQE